MLSEVKPKPAKKKKYKNPGMTIIVLGAPGSGKGTQSELIAKKVDGITISIGKIVRNSAAAGTVPDKVWRAYSRGQMVPDDFVKNQVLKILYSVPKERPVIFDGFPREGNQLGIFQEIIKETGREVDKVIFLEVSVETAITRIGTRRVCIRCGHSVTSKVTNCPVCGGELVKRQDDKPEIVIKRTEEYLDTITEVLDHFAREGVLIHVDGEKNIDEIKLHIFKKLGI